MKISVITPTCDRPVGLALLERFMRRQTVQPGEWIICDGGSEPATMLAPPAAVALLIHEPRSSGAANFANNLLNGIATATGEFLIIAEDDDHMAPTHIETLVQALESRPDVLLAGCDVQQYYNVAHRCWRTFNNIGASLCQTGMRREALPLFGAVIRKCMAAGKFGIDRALWESVPTAQWAITGKQTVIGIKGLPGQPGLGIGHRPGNGWTADPELRQLRAWVGEDAEVYAGYSNSR